MRERDSFTAFYESSFHRVLSASYVWCGDSELARDATQEAFGRAFARWKRLEQEPWKEGWVIVTATNWLRRYWRRLKDEAQLANRVSPFEAGASADTDMHRAIRSLPTRQRQAVLLHYLADYKVAHVADLMGISEGAVKAHLFRGRAALRDDYGTTRTAEPATTRKEH